MTSDTYFPPAEVEGGWRYAQSPEEVRDRAHLDPEKLLLGQREFEWHWGGHAWSMAVIRHGVLAAEFGSYNVLDGSRFDLWSATKSFTSIAFGILLADQAQRETGTNPLALDSRAYELIPEGYPLTDDRKALITVRQLLTMTGGFVGSVRGTAPGTPTALGDGLFEHALGFRTNRHGVDVSRLLADPGTTWEYSDSGFSHLSLVFAHVAGKEIDVFLNERMFQPIGIPPVSWTRSGGGNLIGPHTVPHTGLVLSARELARCGYLLLHGGSWEGSELISSKWLDLATQPSQEFNPHYGYAFWVNSAGTLWTDAPRDAFALMGFQGSRCWVVPSLDLVIARVGSGPPIIHDHFFPRRILDAVI